MNKTASLAMLLALAAPVWACGSSDEDEPDDPEPTSGRLGLSAPADVAAPPADAEVSATGLASKQLEAGTGAVHPFPNSRVRVDYVGWKPDGMMFDYSRKVRRNPSEFALNGVISGWTEGLQLMVVGEVRRFWVPSELAYGDNPTRQGAPAGPLVFDVDLIEILPPDPL
jgi:FKBP-type peptidyl-prolyl cis-trans isomerase